jgi:hypothetical protein
MHAAQLADLITLPLRTIPQRWTYRRVAQAKPVTELHRAFT